MKAFFDADHGVDMEIDNAAGVDYDGESFVIHASAEYAIGIYGDYSYICAIDMQEDVVTDNLSLNATDFLFLIKLICKNS